MLGHPLKKLKYKICVVTGSRAEYFLLKLLMNEINNSDFFELQLIVTGMHMSPEFGFTYSDILADGFKVNKKIETIISSDTKVGTIKSVGLGLLSFGEAFQELNPDLVLMLGDRFEIFAAASAAMISSIPIAHLYGGEHTEGSIDDMLRNAITKMSNIHFVSTETYRNRIIQMGENSEHVHTVGALGIDSIKKVKLLSKKQVENRLNFSFRKKNILIAYHPETSGDINIKKNFNVLLDVISSLDDTSVIFTSSNADAGGRVINKMINDFVSSNSKIHIHTPSLGHQLFFSTIKYVDIVIGNSSSGIIEVPSLLTPTINIGTRQKGRILPLSVQNCDYSYNQIKCLINNIYNEEKQDKNYDTPYGDGQATKKIMEVLEKFNAKQHLSKSFFDIH